MDVSLPEQWWFGPAELSAPTPNTTTHPADGWVDSNPTHYSTTTHQENLT